MTLGEFDTDMLTVPDGGTAGATFYFNVGLLGFLCIVGKYVFFKYYLLLIVILMNKLFRL